MSVTPTLPSTLLPANAAASAFTVADVAPDQATGFAGILRAAGNRAAGAGVADDSAVADPENGSELPVANATADALAAVEMIAPWIVPLLPTGAVVTPAATVGDAVAGAGAQVQLAAMHVSPSPDTPTTVGATAVALTPGAPLPVTALPSASSTVGVMPLTATPVGTTAVASTWSAPRAVDSMPDDWATPVVPPITSAPVASTAATSVPPALTQTTGGEPDRGMGMVAAGEGLELPPVADRIAHAPQAQAALRRPPPPRPPRRLPPTPRLTARAAMQVPRAPRQPLRCRRRRSARPHRPSCAKRRRSRRRSTASSRHPGGTRILRRSSRNLFRCARPRPKSV